MNNRRSTYSTRSTHAARAAHAKGDKMFRSYDTSAIQPKKSKGPAVFGIILALVVVAVLVFGATKLLGGFFGDDDLLPADQSATIVVPEGAGASSIGKSLENAKLIGDTQAFIKRVSALNADTSLKPGTYTIQGGTSMDDIIKKLQAGPGLTGTPVIISEGLTIDQAAERVQSATKGRITADAFKAACADASVYAADYPFLADAGKKSLEGFLFPKTYYLQDTATADTIVRAMLNQFKTEIATLDFTYPTDAGLTLYDAVNLASIVEREGTTNTRNTIASVFYNRLAIGMALQSDATTAYEVGREPTAEEVHADTPYSTYAHAGLTPTPICSPSLASLQAVCNPDTTDYYYFVFKEVDGKLVCLFAETNDEHNANVFG